MKSKVRNLLTGEILEVESRTDHPASSYGKAVWVTEMGEAIGQVDLPLPGYELIPFPASNRV